METQQAIDQVPSGCEECIDGIEFGGPTHPQERTKASGAIVEGGAQEVWAYFPVYERRLIARKFALKPSTRILLLLGSRMFDERSELDPAVHLRDHIGHTLLYLRDPKANNDCVDADRAWKEACI